MKCMYVFKRSLGQVGKESAVEFYEDLLAFCDRCIIPGVSEEDFYVLVPYTETAKLLSAFKELLGEGLGEKFDPYQVSPMARPVFVGEEERRAFEELMEKHNLGPLMVYVREFYRTRTTYDLEDFVSAHPEIKTSWDAHHELRGQGLISARMVQPTQGYRFQ